MPLLDAYDKTTDRRCKQEDGHSERNRPKGNTKKGRALPCVQVMQRQLCKRPGPQRKEDYAGQQRKHGVAATTAGPVGSGLRVAGRCVRTVDLQLMEWYVRLAHPKTRLEAITSRPLLLAAVGRMTRHSRVTKLVLAVTHEAAAQIKVLIANVRAGLSHTRSAAPQLDKAQRWPAMLRYIVAQMLACKAPRGAPPASSATG